MDLKAIMKLAKGPDEEEASSKDGTSSKGVKIKEEVEEHPPSSDSEPSDDEDDGFLCRQLIIHLEDLVNNAASMGTKRASRVSQKRATIGMDAVAAAGDGDRTRALIDDDLIDKRKTLAHRTMNTRSSIQLDLLDMAPKQPPKRDPAEALLDCIEKVKALTASRRMQEKLQDFIMEWLRPPKLPPPRIEPDVRRRVAQREKYWAAYRARVHKAEHVPLSPRNSGDDWAYAQIFAGAAGTPQAMKTSTGSSWHKQMNSSTGSSWHTSGDTQPCSMYSTLKSFHSKSTTDTTRPSSTATSFGSRMGSRGAMGSRCLSRSGQGTPATVLPMLIRKTSLYPPPGVSYDKMREGGMRNIRSLPSLTRPDSRAEEKTKLKNASSFPDLWEDLPCDDLVDSAQRSYFRACQEKKVVPRIPPFLMENGACSIDLHARGFLDQHMAPLLKPLQSVEKVEKLDLSHNSFGDSSVKELIDVVRFPCYYLAFIDLSYSGAADLVLTEVSRCMGEEWKHVSVLRLGGVVLADSTWRLFCETLSNCSATRGLKELCLADTQLGRNTQQNAVRIGNLIRNLRGLEVLDMAGNFFFEEGFMALAEALAETSSLTDLDISHNASGYLVPTKKWRQRPPDPKKPNAPKEYDEVPNFNPVLFFLEGLDNNLTLKTLRMSNCQLEFAADFVLFQSGTGHPKLENVDISDNPHGEDGLRSILRLTMPATSAIVYCDISDVRESCNMGMTLKFDFSEPSGRYDLDLQHPQHRAIFRELLERAWNEGDEVFSKAFRSCTYTAPPGAKGGGVKKSSKDFYSRTSEIGMDGISRERWQFPSEGQVGFSYYLPSVQLDVDNQDAAVRTWYRSHRIPLSMGRFVTLYSMFEGLYDARQKAILICAMRDQLLLKFCHLKRLMMGCPELVEYTARNLFPACEKTDRMVLFDLLKNKDAAKRMRQDAAAAFFFNPANPTDKYDLDIEKPTHRSVAERIYIINVFDKSAVEEKELPDTSQWGGCEGVRNARWNKTYEIKHFSKFSIPFDGVLLFDYASPFTQPKSEKAAPPILVEAMIKALEESECCMEDKVQVIRGISNLITLNHMQVKQFCMFFDNISFMKRDSRTVQQKLKAVKQRLSLLQVTGKVKIKKSAFGLKGANSRLETFVCLFNRCNKQRELVTRDVLYDDMIFTHKDTHTLRERLGYLRTWDLAHVDNPECNLGNRYTLQLFKHEDWVMAKVIILTAIKEPGECLTRCNWTERGFLAEQGYDFLVPAEWITNLPTVGTFTVTYRQLLEAERQLKVREQNGVLYCGWNR